MATVTPTSPIPSVAPSAAGRGLSAHGQQFDRMVRNGFLDEDEPVELLNGILVTKMPKNPPHRVATRKAVRALEVVLPAGWFVQKEDSLVIRPEASGNQTWLSSGANWSSTRDPTAADCCLVVEIVDTNLFRARPEKLPAYATAGIPIYWIVNLGGTPAGSGQVEVYSEPDQAGGVYQSRLDQRGGTSVGLGVINGQEVGRVAVRTYSVTDAPQGAEKCSNEKLDKIAGLRTEAGQFLLGQQIVKLDTRQLSHRGRSTQIIERIRELVVFPLDQLGTARVALAALLPVSALDGQPSENTRSQRLEGDGSRSTENLAHSASLICFRHRKRPSAGAHQ